MQSHLYELAAKAAGRASHSQGRRDQVVWELRGGESPVLVVEGDDGEKLAVKMVQTTRGQLATCPVAFPPQAVNVFPVLEVFAWEHGYGLVMPMADTSLRQWLRDNDESCVIDSLMGVLIDIAGALASIEGKMVHGDLKPENVLRYQGRWCLADFGPSACRLSLSQRDEYRLTPAYAAPEQWRGRPVTSRTDIYAFGVMGFELLNGLRPFPGPTADEFRRQHLSQTAPPLIGMPASLASLIARCLHKNPGRRPTAAQVSALLEAGSADLSHGRPSAIPGGSVVSREDWPTRPAESCG